MKIENKEVSIKIGSKERTFKNLILNSYLDLFAKSFLQFEHKDLPYCFVNFTKVNLDIDENSTEMNYDTILEADLSKNIELITENSIINKYCYENPVIEYQELKKFAGKSIKQLGFANYDYKLNKYIMYAYIDVSKYNIVIQGNQPITISRIDKISSDMKLYTNRKDFVKGPAHLTIRGLSEIKGHDTTSVIPKLYSIGFGNLPIKINKEYLVDDLNITKTGLGEITINNNLVSEYNSDTIFLDEKLKLSDELKLQKPTYNYLIYKFKLYKETYPNPEKPAVYVDSKIYYLQYKKISKIGSLKLKIKYERG